jgi:hypothetical protein
MLLFQGVMRRIQEKCERSVGIEDCALGAANPISDEGLGVDRIAKLELNGLWEHRVAFRDDAQ